MVYINDTTLLATWEYEHCIQFLDLISLDQPEEYAGRCGQWGLLFEGYCTEIRTIHPRGMARINSTHTFYTSGTQEGLFAINMISDYCSVVMQHLPAPLSLSYNVVQNTLVAAVGNELIGVDFVNLMYNRMAGDPDPGSSLGDPSTTRFNRLMDVKHLSNDVLVTVDQVNGRYSFQIAKTNISVISYWDCLFT